MTVYCVCVRVHACICVLQVAVHMVPEKEREEWSVQCAETILK